MKPYPHHKAIKFWAEEDRPREKLLNLGKHNLSSSELLAIILGSGSRDSSALQISKLLLADANNNLRELSKKNVAELMKYKGIGQSKAVSIAAAFELGNRLHNSWPEDNKKPLRSSEEVFRLCKGHFVNLVHEEFWILLLNRANKLIRKMQISSGGISGTVVDIRLILKAAIDMLASGIILVHNHPSGNLRPSEADIQITKKMKEAAHFMDINILDHLIIGGNRYYSFADEGRL